MKKYNQFILENLTNIPKIFYHGSNNLFDLNTLQTDRSKFDSETKKDTSDKSTGSSQKFGNCHGFYLTKDLWSGPKRDERIYQPLYNEGTSGNESAEKYAYQLFSTKKIAYIYQIELTDDVNLQQGTDACVDNTEYNNYIKNGIDGLYGSNESVIFNSKKIKSLVPIYYADSTCYIVSELVRGTPNNDNAIIVPYEYINYALKQKLGDVYRLVDTRKDGSWLYYDGKKGEDSVKNPVLVKQHNYPFDWKKYKK